jgi:hypothetical protein
MSKILIKRDILEKKIMKKILLFGMTSLHFAFASISCVNVPFSGIVKIGKIIVFNRIICTTEDYDTINIGHAVAPAEYQTVKGQHCFIGIYDYNVNGDLIRERCIKS